MCMSVVNESCVFFLLLCSVLQLEEMCPHIDVSYKIAPQNQLQWSLYTQLIGHVL